MRLRVRSTKLGKVRFISHRDAARAWERAARRIVLPVARSGGFTPRPRMSFGLALPTGAESLAEYVDMEIASGVDAAGLDLDSLPARLSEALPVGFDATAVADVTGMPGSLQESVTSCTWELWSPQISAEAVAAATGLLELDELVIERERKGERRSDDVRPLVLDLRSDDTGLRLVADLATTGRALRPAELAAHAFPHVDPLDVRVLRIHQWTSHDGERREPISLPAAVAAPSRWAGA